MKLYARKGAGSDVVQAVLEICNQPCQVEYLEKDAKGQLPASLRLINPRSEVPTLILDDGTVMTESAAIILYLADTFPAANLAPTSDSRLRPRYLRWTLFLAAATYASMLQYYYPDRLSDDPAVQTLLKAKAVETMNRDFAILSDAIGNGPFILGKNLSAADIYATMLLSWANDLPALFKRHPNLAVLCTKVMSVPEIARVWGHLEF